jgi:hypothetical protein
VGATTLNEYRKYIEKDAALARRFQSVYVAEPTVHDTIAILRGRTVPSALPFANINPTFRRKLCFLFFS